MTFPFQLHPEVANALAENRPVVALESTFIAHGLPYPENIEVARQMETAVSRAGSVPAMVAVIQGVAHVGLTTDELTYLATRPAASIYRCSRRNLPIAIAQQADGATTVAGTMIIAHHASIEVFATGAIGGVHRHDPFDRSADLMELGRTPTTVVCSGMKPFLDLAATHEMLKTQGVLTIGLGTDDIAPYFIQHSQQSTDISVSSPEEVATIITARRALQLNTGTVVSIPLPPALQWDQDTVDRAIDETIHAADVQGVRGSAVTMWIINRLAEVLGPETLRSNTQLLCHNAYMAALIAAALQNTTTSY